MLMLKPHTLQVKSDADELRLADQRYEFRFEEK
ncbi:hypothetical protein J056_003810 [Wallemia ichthyophaga EXF-994]|uniref:Uncharacterized protein n=1 Tax=Wallemia ichthyophaga (strain EXF-994 / CBS 113033) TaxID=1299270 RepID=R9A8V1_WALI9|nr:uncharacterized protein J056_003810 [Wallemia ichthyophaga EXF-994]EOQ98648.1 hypothetical protein J056_003810 [Wallemia ichthyophaga EXF-994]